MSMQLDIEVTDHAPDRARGVATRCGFTLPWSGTFDGVEWVLEVPRGHSLGPSGKGAFEIVTDHDWPRFIVAVERVIVQGGA